MDILVVAATAEEAKGINLKEIESSTPHQVELLVTGVGMVATTYSLAKKFNERKFDLALNIGLAGSFHDNFKIGDTVNVASDCFADIGAEDDDKFLRLDELGLADKNSFPFKDGKLTPVSPLISNVLNTLKKVNGITVNKVHGNERSIKLVKSIFNPDVESMEGAAFFYVCMMEKIPCLQIRSISNKVEKRNREAWNIPLALKNLSNVVTQFIEELK